MAYRALVVGDDVKVVKAGAWTGMFGKVLSLEGDYIKVECSSWSDMPPETHYFTDEQLLLSNGNPHAGFQCESNDEDDFAEKFEYRADSVILRELLERVATLEKQMLDVLKLAA